MSLKEYRIRFLDGVVDLLWRQWSALGVSSHADADARVILDLDALVVFSSWAARYDERLYDLILSWLIVLGAMVICDVKFNLINIIISTFIFGIGVDYSIFVMTGLIGDQNNKAGSRNLLKYHKTAILLSAIVLIVTVASMLFALHPAIKSVGFATLVGMISAVVLAYVVQPLLFRILNKK